MRHQLPGGGDLGVRAEFFDSIADLAGINTTLLQLGGQRPAREPAAVVPRLHPRPGERGIPDTVAVGVLDKYADVGLIDDAAFARAWVESRHYSRGLAGRALAAELKQRGVGAGEIRDAIEELGPAAEAATARKLVAQKLAGTRGQPAQARTRRLAGMLARKGYPPGLAFRVIREAMEAEGADGAPGEEPYFDDTDALTE